MFNFLKRRRAGAPLPRPTEMQIVCGDCAGDDVRPRRTSLLSDGTCAGCGGRSFVCAVRLFKIIARHLAKQNEVEKTK